jgi:hypothetical protein
VLGIWALARLVLNVASQTFSANAVQFLGNSLALEFTGEFSSAFSF